jgi:outer membrane protein TolC
LQQIATKEARASLIEIEVLNAIDQLEANWQLIVAARARVTAAVRVLQAEIQQFNQGFRTSTDVLDAQARAASAALAEIQAMTEYQTAQVDIAFATGTVLGSAKVVWAPAPAPKR